MTEYSHPNYSESRARERASRELLQKLERDFGVPLNLARWLARGVCAGYIPHSIARKPQGIPDENLQSIYGFGKKRFNHFRSLVPYAPDA